MGSPIEGPIRTPIPRPKRISKADQGNWRQALEVPIKAPSSPSQGSCRHPLERLPADIRRPANGLWPLRRTSEVSETNGEERAKPSNWDAADEAVHRAFCRGAVVDPRLKLDL